MILIDTEGLAQLVGVTALDECVRGPGWTCHLWNAQSARLLDAPAPEPWQPGCWTWDAENVRWRLAAIPEGYADWMAARISSERDARIAAGMPYAFPDGNGTVQLRNERDITNVIGVGTSGMMLDAAGDAETTVGFRDQEDVTHTLTGAQAQALGQKATAWISAHYTAAWTHKDAVKRLAEAGNLAALDDYDIGAGWPEVGAAAAA